MEEIKYSGLHQHGNNKHSSVQFLSREKISVPNLLFNLPTPSCDNRPEYGPDSRVRAVDK